MWAVNKGAGWGQLCPDAPKFWKPGRPQKSWKPWAVLLAKASDSTGTDTEAGCPHCAIPSEHSSRGQGKIRGWELIIFWILFTNYYFNTYLRSIMVSAGYIQATDNKQLPFPRKIAEARTDTPEWHGCMFKDSYVKDFGVRVPGVSRWLKTSGEVCGHCGDCLGWHYLWLETEQGGL